MAFVLLRTARWGERVNSKELLYNAGIAYLSARFEEAVEMVETKIGAVTHYFNHLHVAAVPITGGELRKGDTIHLKGRTTDFQQTVVSIQIDHEPVDTAKVGQSVGIEMIEQVREHDSVYKVT